jgi:hypothetical protein
MRQMHVELIASVQQIPNTQRMKVMGRKSLGSGGRERLPGI